jgi:hypothetical protein
VIEGNEVNEKCLQKCQIQLKIKKLSLYMSCDAKFAVDGNKDISSEHRTEQNRADIRQRTAWTRSGNFGDI